MRPRGFGLMQLTLGVALLATAYALAAMGWPIAWLLAWPSASVIVVSAGYLALGPGVFGKRSDGSLRALPTLLLLPYHVVIRARVAAEIAFSRESAWDEVAPDLYLGRLVRGAAIPPRARVLVDLTSELDASSTDRAGRTYHLLPALDADVPQYEDFAALARALAADPGPIFVHCAAGHGRSATFAAALLVARGAARNAEEAEAILRSKRPRVKLHAVQREHVDRLAAELRALSRVPPT